MYIYNRTSLAIADRYPEALAFAVSIAAKVEAVSGHPIRAYVTHFGAPVTTLSWSTRLDSLADLETMKGKLAADPGLAAEMQQNRSLFVGSPEDALMNIVSTTFDAKPKKYYASTVAMAAGGKVGEAVQFGVEVQQHLSKLTGLQSAFGTNPFGPYGQVGWITGADSMAEIDAFQTAMGTDPAFQKMAGVVGDLFLPGSGQSRLIERIN